MARTRGYWILKTEPTTYGIDDLAREDVAMWDGVRNYEARNHLRDDMRIGDRVLVYHSSCAVPAIAGVAEIVRAAYPDPTAPHESGWVAVDVAYKARLHHAVTRAELSAHDVTADMRLLARGNRLSVLPITYAQYRAIVQMGL